MSLNLNKWALPLSQELFNIRQILHLRQSQKGSADQKTNFNELDNDITMKILFSLCQIRKKYNKIPPKTDDQIKNILSDNMNRLLLDVFQALKLYERQETDIFEKDYFRQRNKMLIRTFSLPETYKGDGQFEQLFNFMSLFETALNSEITKNEMLCTNEDYLSFIFYKKNHFFKQISDKISFIFNKNNKTHYPLSKFQFKNNVQNIHQLNMGLCQTKSSKDNIQKQNKARLFDLLNSTQTNRQFKLSIIEGQTVESVMVLQEAYKQPLKGFVSQKQQETLRVLSLLQKIIIIYSQGQSTELSSASDFDKNQFTMILNKLVIDIYETLRDFQASNNFSVQREKFKYSAKLIVRKYKISNYYSEFQGPLKYLLDHMSLIFHTLSQYFEDKTISQIRFETEEELFCFNEQNTLYTQLKQDLLLNDQNKQ
ncbi:hypothetical protein pb186bvf_019600 [Paramecium bursaria]